MGIFVLDTEEPHSIKARIEAVRNNIELFLEENYCYEVRYRYLLEEFALNYLNDAIELCEELHKE